MRYALLGILAASVIFSGCQTVLNKKSTLLFNDNASLSCKAALGCKVIRIDDRKFTTAAERASHVELSAGKHEVAIEFYPVSENQVERFSFIHTFAQNADYLLTIYRQRGDQPQTLTNAALPSKLCIDLLENNHIAQRFCRKYSAANLKSEFSKQDVPKNTN